MRLLVDNQLPAQLAVHLRTRGHDGEHVLDLHLGNCRNAALIAAFDHVHEDLVRALEAGQRIVEIR